jgi:FkbM family methyltransferase
LRAVRHLPGDVALGASLADGLRFWRLRHFPPATGEQNVCFAALGGASLALRAGTTDAQVAWYTLALGALLPPPSIPPPRRIVDLGANIGVVSALLATRFPQASILAVEPDPANAASWRRNVAPWAARCELLEAAAWDRPGPVRLALKRGAEDAAHVSESGTEVPTVTLEKLVERSGGIDYLKVNVEGAERELLASSGWERVGAVKIEVHAPLAPEDCRRALAALGFDASLETVGRDAYAVGVRAAR